MIHFRVDGVPQPKGSYESFMRDGKKRFFNANPKTAPWQKKIRNVAQTFAPATLFIGAVKVEVTFYFEKPKTTKYKAFPIGAPDVDKCLRAVLDAMTGVIYKDDKQVVDAHPRELYGTPGADISVIPLEELDGLGVLTTGDKTI